MFYRPDPVSVEPELAIYQWTVMELPNGDRHLAGNVRNGHDGRVSSKIVDYADSVITTRSGRRYHLCGPASNLSLNAEYVWKMWCHIHRIDATDALDVSDKYQGATRS